MKLAGAPQVSSTKAAVISALKTHFSLWEISARAHPACSSSASARATGASPGSGPPVREKEPSLCSGWRPENTSEGITAWSNPYREGIWELTSASAFFFPSHLFLELTFEVPSGLTAVGEQDLLSGLHLPPSSSSSFPLRG